MAGEERVADSLFGITDVMTELPETGWWRRDPHKESGHVRVG